MSGRGRERGPGGETPGGGLVTIGPRTTVHVLLAGYPSLREQLLDYDPAFSPLAGPQRRAAGWARVTTLNDIAVAMDVPWRRVVRDLRERIERDGGDAPPVSGSGTVLRDDGRLAALRVIVGQLENGGSLPQLAERLRALTSGLTAADAAALERALVDGAERARDEAEARVMLAAGAPQAVPPPPPGHPLDGQGRAARQLRLLTGDLAAELAKMGGSPSRRRWRSAKPMLQRLIERISDVETMFRRHRQAWFPALSARGVEGPGTLLADREDEALELLRRLRLAVDRDDAAFVADAGARLAGLIDDLLGTFDVILVPLAERHLSMGDWAVVRELEDGVGYAFIPPPPSWPDPGSPTG